jgi:hypothetical protein
MSTIPVTTTITTTTQHTKAKRGRPKSLTSQEGKILEFLKSGNTLTRLQAQKLFDCAELPARIHALRQAGWQIMSEPYISSTGKHLVKYRLADERKTIEISFECQPSDFDSNKQKEGEVC